MFRFAMNRSWAFVLTLCLLTTCFLSFAAPSTSFADSGSGSFVISPDGGDPLPSLGDPDVPMGPGDGKAGKLTVVRNSTSQVVPQRGAVLVGEEMAPISVATNPVQLFLLGLRAIFLRF